MPQGIPELSDEFEEVMPYIEEFEKRTQLFLSDFINEVAYKNFSSAAEEAEDKVADLDPSNKLEELAKKDMQYLIDNNRVFADFLTHKTDITVSDMLDTLHGDGTYRRIEKKAKEKRKRDEINNKETELEYGISTRPVVDEFKEMAEADAARLNDLIERYAKRKDGELLPGDFEYRTVLMPAGREQRGSWDGENNILYLGLDYFRTTIEEEESTLDSTGAIFTIFHELLGHGVHQQNSEELIYPGSRSNTLKKPSAGAHSEGVAQKSRQLAFEFIEEFKEDLHVSDRDIEVVRLRSDERHRAAKLYTSIMKEMTYREEIDRESALEEVGEAYPDYLAERVFGDPKYAVHEIFSEAEYIAGNLLMEKVNWEEKSHKALTTGAWHPQVFPEAVEYFEDLYSEEN